MVHIVAKRGRELFLMTNVFTSVLTHLEPLVHALRVEFMITGQDSKELANLEVTHADHTTESKSQNHLKQRVG